MAFFLVHRADTGSYRVETHWWYLVVGKRRTNRLMGNWWGKRNAVMCIGFWRPRGICLLFFFTFLISLELLEVLNVPLCWADATICCDPHVTEKLFHAVSKDRCKAEQEGAMSIFIDCSSFQMSVMNINHLQTQAVVYWLDRSHPEENVMVLGLRKSHFRPSVWREVWNWTVKKSIIHLFIHLFSSLGESPNHEHPFTVLESLLCFHRDFGQGEIVDPWEWFLLCGKWGLQLEKVKHVAEKEGRFL